MSPRGAPIRTIPIDYPIYGRSTYNRHRDGSGIAFSSRHRPILTMRPGFLTFHDPRGSGMRHYPADLHLLAWLEAKGFDFDIVTDEDLDDEGVALIAPYRAVLTGSHPEYHTLGTLDALAAYTRQGGRLCYLGGNGFYWRVARDKAAPHLIELRRAEGGIRTWAAEPGEYYHQTDGQLGGLWRRNRRPPQMLVGVGFSCQAAFEGTHYRRLPASRDPRFAWMFDGIDEDVLGDYGLSGGGAAGFELDRADPMLGTPDGAVILARSENPLPSFLTVPEELLSNTVTHQRRAGRGPGARRDRVFRHAVRRRGVLGRLDHLLRQPVAQRLRRAGLAAAGERGAPLRHWLTGCRQHRAAPVAQLQAAGRGHGVPAARRDARDPLRARIRQGRAAAARLGHPLDHHRVRQRAHALARAGRSRCRRRGHACAEGECRAAAAAGGYYEVAREFGRIASERGGAFAPQHRWRDNVIATGGGPGIMEAANRGAFDAGAPSIGFNITLPDEQEPNAYITPELSFHFHYFAMRKMHLAMRANALAIFPGGFGTMDELFEILTLQQTRKAPPAPVVLFGERLLAAGS